MLTATKEEERGVMKGIGKSANRKRQMMGERIKQRDRQALRRHRMRSADRRVTASDPQRDRGERRSRRRGRRSRGRG